jgi:putative ABC transport system permease protein
MDLLRELRLTLRHLWNSPGYTAATVLTLALAIGATSAIFSAVHAVLLRPFPMHEPDDLVICWGTDPSRNQAVVELSHRNFRDWADGSRSFVQTAAMGSSAWPAVLEGRGEPIRLSSVGVSASFFDTLGVPPLHGRVFRTEDEQPNAPRVVVLSHGAWVRLFGADPGVIGTVIRVNGPHTVVGVMPAGFDFPRGTDYWTPVVPMLVGAAAQWGDGTLQNVGVLFVIGRLRDGVTRQMATEDLDGIAAGQEAVGIPRFGTAVVMTPLLDYVLGPVRQALWWLFGAVGVLLLIACANVSGLLLTRVTTRQREHVIRVALGATRMQIGRLWVLETGILVLVSGLAGFAAAGWIAGGIAALAPEDVPRLADVSIDARVGAFTLVVMGLALLLCGAGPVLQAGASNVSDALKDAAYGGGRPLRARSALVTLQIALSVVLLVTAGLIVRSFVHLRQIDLGFDPSSVLVMNVDPRNAKPSLNRWLHDLLDRIGRMPGVESAGAVYLKPLALGPIGQGTGVQLEGQTPGSETQANPTLNYQVATPGYFRTMRIPLRQGRLFDARDDERSPRVAIVSESTARRLWPGQDPIGKRVLMPAFAPDAAHVWRTVVGVVGNVRYRGLNEVQFDIYDAALQAASPARELAIRTSGDPVALAAAVQAEARRRHSDVIVDGITTMDAIVARALAPWRFSSWLFALFATLAFALAAVGLFSLVSLDAAQRAREFAVRVALGARPQDILRRVFFSAGARVLKGMALGLAVAVIAAQSIRTLLFGVEPLDAPTYVGVLALVTLVVALASYVPARRAARVDPIVLLRRE